MNSGTITIRTVIKASDSHLRKRPTHVKFYLSECHPLLLSTCVCRTSIVLLLRRASAASATQTVGTSASHWDQTTAAQPEDGDAAAAADVTPDQPARWNRASTGRSHPGVSTTPATYRWAYEYSFDWTPVQLRWDRLGMM